MKKLLLPVLSGGAVLFAAYFFYLADKSALSPLSPGVPAGAGAEPGKLAAAEFVRQAGVEQIQNPVDFSSLDSFARNTPEKYEKDIRTLAGYLQKPAKNDLEKARLAFTWVATHIRYDSDGYNKGRVSGTSAERVLHSRNSVCEGYSNLFEALAKEMGLTAVTVSGYAKGLEYVPGKTFSQSNHAWNAVRTGNSWRLIDATWGSGYGIPGKNDFVAVAKFEPFWFDVPPKAFIFTHLPEESEWQFLQPAVSKAQFEAFQHLGETYFKLGFDPARTYSIASENNRSEFVNTFTVDFGVKVLEMPHELWLKRGRVYKFAVEAPALENLVLIDNRQFIKFEKKNGVFTLSHKPRGPRVSINGMKRKGDKRLPTVAEYKVR